MMIASVASLNVSQNLIDCIILNGLLAIRCPTRETEQIINGVLLAALQGGIKERISVLITPHYQVILCLRIESRSRTTVQVKQKRLR